MAGFGLAASAMGYMINGMEKPLIPAVYFKELHQRNVKAYEARLIAFITAESHSTSSDASTPGNAVTPASGNEGMSDAVHETLSELLHKYCKCYHSKLLYTCLCIISGEALGDFERMEMRPDLKTKQRIPPQLPGISLIGLGIQGLGRTDNLKGIMGNVVDILTSFLFALAGGTALIAPMLIMVLYPSRNTSLVVTCVFVFAFAVGLALYSTVITYIGARYKPLHDVVKGSNLQAKEILGATAAYAAVLVVFVGTSTTISPSA